MAKVKVCDIDRNELLGSFGINREHTHDEKHEGDRDCDVCKDSINFCASCSSPNPTNVKQNLDAGCWRRSDAYSKNWIQCPDCSARFQLVACLFRHASIAHYNQPLLNKYPHYLKFSPGLKNLLQKKNRSGECPYCHEDLGFRIGWDSTPEKKTKCWILHLGFKHRMILNHMPEEIFKEYNDELNPDKGSEIPCLMCPEGTKKFMCASNYVNHLAQDHCWVKIMAEYNPDLDTFDCPICNMDTSDDDNYPTWFVRHLACNHGRILDFVEEKVASQLCKLGVVRD